MFTNSCMHKLVYMLTSIIYSKMHHQSYWYCFRLMARLPWTLDWVKHKRYLERGTSSTQVLGLQLLRTKCTEVKPWGTLSTDHPHDQIHHIELVLTFLSFLSFSRLQFGHFMFNPLLFYFKLILFKVQKISPPTFRLWCQNLPQRLQEPPLIYSFLLSSLYCPS